MALTVQALTTVRSLEEELDLEPGTDSGALERAIKAASAEIARVTGRVLYRVADAVDRVASYGGYELLVPRAPIVSVTSVERLGDDGTSVEETYATSTYHISDSDAGILYRSSGWPWTSSQRSGVTNLPVAGQERPSIRVTYTAGWITPYQASATGGSVGTRDLPYDLEEACLIAAASRYRSRGRDRAVVSERLGPESVRYAAPSSSSVGRSSWLPEEAYSIANSYRRTL